MTALHTTSALALACATVMITGAAHAGVIDPPWQRGGPNTTFQYWQFNTPSINPTQWDNPNGQPILDPHNSVWLLDNPLSPVPGTGVWCVQDGGGLSFFIPNFNRQDPKEIFISIKYSVPSSGVGVPDVTITGLDGSAGVPCGPTYTPGPTPIPGVSQIAYGMCMPTCSSFVATIRFPVGIPGSVGYIEQVAIDTRCIPAPGAAGLLALAGLAAGRRRRR